MRVLITGIEGFVGRHLSKFLVSKSEAVCGSVEKSDLIPSLRIELPDVEYYNCDITAALEIESLLEKTQPEAIVHLAAQSSGKLSFNHPVDTFKINVLGTLNLLQAVRKCCPGCLILLVTSGEIYELPKGKSKPFKEDDHLAPLNPYSCSKAAQDLVGYQYFRSYGLRIIRARSFSHSGPGQSVQFVLSSFARQIAKIEKEGSNGEIKVGRLDAIRDFTDVRDIVNAYYLLIQKGKVGEAYNVCSGKGYSLKDLLEKLKSQSSAKIEVKQDPELIRPVDMPYHVGDNSKLITQTNWQPSIPIDKTLTDILNHWRKDLN